MLPDSQRAILTEARDTIARMEHDAMPGIARFHVVNTGPCPGCSECGLAHIQHADEDEYAYVCSQEGFTSRTPCDACGDRKQGKRYPAHAWEEGGEIEHLNLCSMCYDTLA